MKLFDWFRKFCFGNSLHTPGQEPRVDALWLRTMPRRGRFGKFVSGSWRVRKVIETLEVAAYVRLPHFSKPTRMPMSFATLLLCLFNHNTHKVSKRDFVFRLLCCLGACSPPKTNNWQLCFFVAGFADSSPLGRPFGGKLKGSPSKWVKSSKTSANEHGT